eukprot:6211060-Pleurochrysis_carterae.AAC.1
MRRGKVARGDGGKREAPDKTHTRIPRFPSLTKPLGETSTPAAKQQPRQRDIRQRDRDLDANCLERNNGNQRRDEGRGDRKRRRATANGKSS